MLKDTYVCVLYPPWPAVCSACFEDLSYGLCTYNFWTCITLEQLQNTSTSALILETWKIISIRNKLTRVYPVYIVNKWLHNQILSIVLSSKFNLMFTKDN